MIKFLVGLFRLSFLQPAGTVIDPYARAEERLREHVKWGVENKMYDPSSGADHFSLGIGAIGWRAYHPTCAVGLLVSRENVTSTYTSDRFGNDRSWQCEDAAKHLGVDYEWVRGVYAGVCHTKASAKIRIKDKDITCKRQIEGLYAGVRLSEYAASLA